MVEVIHEHESASRSNNNFAMVGILLVVAVLVILFLMYVLPLLSRPTTPSVTVPDQIDVNVNPGTQGTGNGQ